MTVEKNLKAGKPSGSAPSIFATFTVVCPMCNKNSSHQKIKPHVFIEKDLDVDLRPKNITWTIQSKEKAHPAHYYMISCPHCHFTAAARSFEDPLKSSSLSVSRFKTKVSERLEKSADLKKVFNELSTRLQEQQNHFEAIKLHLLAIFHLQIVDEIVQQDSIDLGRYSLRLAWLYRELSESPELQSSFEKDIQEFLKSLRLQWPEIPDTEEAALRDALKHYRNALERSSKIESIKEEVDLLLMIARVAIALQDIPTAKHHVDLSKDRCRKLEEQIKKEGDKDTTDLAAELRRIKSASEVVLNILHDSKDAWETAQRKKAEELLKPLASKTTEEKRAALSGAGFDAKLINSLAPLPQKKKGLFGGLFS